MNKNDEESVLLATSVMEPVKYTNFEKRISFIACLLFSFVLIVAIFFPELLQVYRAFFGLIFAFSCFILIATDVSAARRSGVITIKSAVIKKTNQPFMFWLTYISKFLISLACLSLIWYFLST